MSLPAWGEWIEINNNGFPRSGVPCLSPHGESGLKSAIITNTGDNTMSLPAWGEWIEIVVRGCGFFGICQSLPAWGEWIEISNLLITSATSLSSLPAWGEWIEIFSIYFYKNG